MSAAATAAGYLYASGRLSKRKWVVCVVDKDSRREVEIARVDAKNYRQAEEAARAKYPQRFAPFTKSWFMVVARPA